MRRGPKARLKQPTLSLYPQEIPTKGIDLPKKVGALIFWRICMKKQVLKLTYSALFLALCMLLPMLTGQIQPLGQALSPMHIPVLLCGFVCGWPYGLAVGFIAPLLRSMIFGMPPLFPMALSMAFELAVYGLMTGILHAKLPKKVPFIYVSLLASMLAGRLVWGAARFVFAGLASSEFSFSMFLAGAFTTALPGIILHIVIIPPLVIAVQAIEKKQSRQLG